jgi:predicted dithiol-disulfide oxidoreductase (DUF899 family)
MTHEIAPDAGAWRARRVELLAAEKAATAERDRLAAARRALPWRRIDVDYRFEAETGEKGLADLFGGLRQLIVQHFMFRPEWEAGCRSCSFWADGFARMAPHLAARDTAIVLVSRAPLAKLVAFRARMGWPLDWVSSGDGPFNRDFGVSFDLAWSDRMDYNYREVPFGETGSAELPGISVFIRGEDGVVFHAYSAYGRGLDALNPAYQLLDLTPLGRQEAGLPFPMAWLRHRDAYAG